MSSSSSSSSKTIFPQNQGQLFDQQNGISTSTMNIGQHSPSRSSSTTRIIAPRPFYRSQVTPDPFDYSNYSRRQADQQNSPQRRNSAHQIDDSQFSNSYSSDHESSSSTISMHPHYHQQYRSTNNTNPNNNNNNRALISVTSKQPPLITIASGSSPSRSQILVSSSPKTNQSTVREIHISRPDSPSISINRTGANQPITFTTNANGGTITNGTGGAFHISVGTPTKLTPRGRTSPSFHQLEMQRNSIDNRYTSNVVANRFKPLIAYTSPNSNIYDRTTAIVNLPPAPNSTSLTMRIKKEQTEVDHLTKLLMKSMNSSTEPNVFGMCARCNDEIVGEENGLVAMDRMYHVSCFTCTMCGCRLRGMHFYSMENKPYCEPCYINSLEKCVVCSQPITDRILRATGKPYHAQCFCCIACQKSLDGISFTVDATMQIHCLDCFHQKFAPRCYVCHRAILPINADEETVRIVALDRSYHIDCYRCENCKIQFTSEEGCYPSDDHIFCLQCNRLYTRTMLGEHQ